MSLDLAFVSDPAWVEPGPAAWLYMLLVCGVGPLSALRSRKVLAGESLPVPRLRIYASTFIWLAALTVLAVLTARQSGIWLFPPPHVSLTDAAVGVGGLAIGLLAGLPLRKFLAPGRKRVSLLAPRSAADSAGFTAVAAMAAFGEEVIYRGVLFMLFAALTGSWWIAAVLASIAFGLAHLAYGWRHALVIVFYGLRDHLVVGLTGSLYVAMAVHFAHDMIVGVRASRAAKQAEAEEAAEAAGAPGAA